MLVDLSSTERVVADFTTTSNAWPIEGTRSSSWALSVCLVVKWLAGRAGEVSVASASSAIGQPRTMHLCVQCMPQVHLCGHGGDGSTARLVPACENLKGLVYACYGKMTAPRRTAYCLSSESLHAFGNAIFFFVVHDVHVHVALILSER